MSILLIIETFEEPEVTVGTTMTTVTPLTAAVAPISTTPSALVSAIPSAPISAVPTALILTGPGTFSFFPPIPYFFIMNSFLLLHGFSHRISCSLSSPILTALSQFEVGSSSTTVPNPVSKAIAFFTCFDQPEVNDLDPADFWGSGPPYVDFHVFRVLRDCVSHLEAVYSSCSDFMQGFHLGRSAREYLLKLLGCVMNDIEHNFVDTILAERILQWRAAV